MINGRKAYELSESSYVLYSEKGDILSPAITCDLTLEVMVEMRGLTRLAGTFPLDGGAEPHLHRHAFILEANLGSPEQRSTTVRRCDK